MQGLMERRTRLQDLRSMEVQQSSSAGRKDPASTLARVAENIGMKIEPGVWRNITYGGWVFGAKGSSGE